MSDYARMSHADMLKLKRWNTPTIYNGWEAFTKNNRAGGCFNLEPVCDFMPQMGPMVGRAITLVIEPSNPIHQRANTDPWLAYRQYIAEQPDPKIVVVQDLDKPVMIGSFWGEVNANAHRMLGCVGTICDGAIRDVDEMTNAGFKALARGMCIGHAYSAPVRWGCEVVAFGCSVRPGQLIHADKHGFLAVPEEDEAMLLRASRFMDDNECETVINASRGASGLGYDELIRRLSEARNSFSMNTRHFFEKK